MKEKIAKNDQHKNVEFALVCIQSYYNNILTKMMWHLCINDQ